jgi:site-specific DNA-methyltransferase (adenine-specific)
MIIRDGSLFYCSDAMAIMTSMPDESVHCIVTDPPYRVVSGGMRTENANGYKNSRISGAENGKIFAHNDIAISAFLPEFYRLLKPGSHCYVMINRINMRELLNVADAAGFHLHNILRWDKPNVNTNRWYMIDCEFTIMLAKRPVKTINNPGSKQGFSARFDRAKVHPTEKPVELMQHYIENSTQPGETVFDPFAGCGSTLIAAQRSGRYFIGCEIDPMWYNVGLVRLW